MVKALPGTLPGKPETNPREYLKVIELRDKTESLPRKNDAEIDRSVIEIDRSDDESDYSFNDDDDLYYPGIDLQDVIDRSDLAKERKKTSEDRPIQDEIGRSQSNPNVTTLREQYVLINGIRVVIGDQAPPLSERTKTALDSNIEKLWKEMRVRLPFKEIKSMTPLIMDRMRKVISGMSTMQEAADTLQQVCNEKMREKFPTKLEDPGRFTIPCTIGSFRYKRSLVDLGASINMMPLSEAKRLGLLHMKPTNISLAMADGSTRRPVGKLINIPVLVGGCYALVDFVVLNLDDNGTDLILGCPFLATTKASINVPKGRIKLHFEKSSMSFYVETIDTLPTMDGQTFVVEDSEAINEVQTMNVTPGNLMHDMDMSFKDKDEVKEEESLAHVLEALTAPRPVIDAERHGPDEETTVPLMGQNLI